MFINILVTNFRVKYIINIRIKISFKKIGQFKKNLY